MATRCGIKLRSEHGHPVHIYRHWDGYPECTGFDLVKHVASVVEQHNQSGADMQSENQHVENLKALLLSQVDKETKYKHYEETTDVALHGDIEWLYNVTVNSQTISLEVIKVDGTGFSNMYPLYNRSFSSPAECKLGFSDFVKRKKHVWGGVGTLIS